MSYKQYPEYKKIWYTKHKYRINKEREERMKSYPLITCACGCGNNLPMFDKRGRSVRFIKGHVHIGRKRTEETKRKISESNSKKVLTPEEINRLRELARQRIGKPLSEEHRLKISIGGKARNGWNYIGKYPYAFNGVFKERIRKRDNYCCVLCFNSQSLFKRKLHIHHIDLDKKNNIDSNGITLCFNCHAKVHKRMSKEEGIIFLRGLLNKRYGYQYEPYQESELFQ